ncbi:hypothetical protein EMPS_03520 [Entomortierella parvispora]|uniref:Uncharacterized protein n=1 Tax=Entomortierella parvispora TaxID=205924 RepID=A0A9P3LUY8_9FUNG|nr:hypothetical protein EMPS_03520 [Entomortierella parvispora]
MSMARTVLHTLLLFWLAQNIQAAEPCGHCGAEPIPMPALIELHARATPDIGAKPHFRASDAQGAVTDNLNMAAISKGSLSSHKRRFVKTMGLRHKPTMDWGMRARAKNQVHWDKYWYQLETGKQWAITNADEPPTSNFEDKKDVEISSSSEPGVDSTTNGSFSGSFKPETTPDSQDEVATDTDDQSGPEGADMNGQFSQDSSSTGAASDDDPGFYFFQQILDHFSTLKTKPSETSSLAEEFDSKSGSENLHGSASWRIKSTFRQYYHISSEFYKPGGPVILWLPGETPLHSLFLRRGLAYEMANATSGLLVALEHRFYGKSIPRFQDAFPSDPAPSNRTMHKRDEQDQFGGSERVKGSKTYADDSSKTRGAGVIIGPLLFGSQSNSSSPADADAANNSTSDSVTRWILAGCSYGGNLAAWTRQRYPSKIFAAFASSAPVRSALDFFEYSTSQMDVLGPQCSQDLAAARDFLDSALQTTDAFMDQMSSLQYGTNFNITSFNPVENQNQTNSTSTQPPAEGPTSDKQKRYEAKLDVLSWFSPDFAHEYSVDGEEVHAAGWIWWTVASAVQYNAVVTPPTSLPVKTVVDVLCETMADQRIQREKSLDSLETEARNLVAGIFETKALASWFKDQQFFTPTKTADLQPSDIDPNSVQNLASMAWLWQTCSELGYLQTSRPSTCCCSQQSSGSQMTSMEVENDDMHTENEASSAIAVDREIVSLASKGICSLRDWIFRSFRVPSPFVEEVTTPPMSAAFAPPCLPCQCYSQGAQRKDSVFSRLLTLEAAWEECQFYFAKTEGQNQSVDKLRTLMRKSPLLKSYPDVEHNVNNKFRGWEIAEDDEDETLPVASSDHVQAMSQNQGATCRGSSLLSKDDGLDGISVVHEMQKVDTSTLYPSSQLQSVVAIESEIHTGGRYYFTNGENDPWKELTLASSNAQAFLSQRNALRQTIRKRKKAVAPDTLISRSSPAATTVTATNSAAVAFTPIALPFPDKIENAVSPLQSTHLESHSRINKDYSYHHHDHYYHQEIHGKHNKYRQNSRHRHRRYSPIGGSTPGSTLTPTWQDPQSAPDLSASNTAVSVDEDDNGDGEAVDNIAVRPETAAFVGDKACPTACQDAIPSLDSTPSPSIRDLPDSPSSTPSAPIAVHLADDEDEVGDRTVMRIIPGASHCQDILYESTDLDSIELRAERQHVLNTFVRWIAIDVRRQEQRRQKQTEASATGAGTSADIQ